MTAAVLDASVVLKWFSREERHRDAALAVRGQYESGDLTVLVPPLLWLELLNVAGRRWGWDGPGLDRMAATLPALGFEEVEPEPTAIAAWIERGLTAYDSAYTAVAEETGAELVTDDERIVAVAPGVSRPLASWA